MKKSVVILLMLLYSFSSSGMLLNLHFCEDSLNEISLSNEQPDCCCGEMMADESATDESGCCSNATVSAKLSIDQNISELEHYLLKHISHLCDIPVFSLGTFSLPDTQGTDPLRRSISSAQYKGRWQDIPLYKTTCSFIYYG